MSRLLSATFFWWYQITNVFISFNTGIFERYISNEIYSDTDKIKFFIMVMMVESTRKDEQKHDICIRFHKFSLNKQKIYTYFCFNRFRLSKAIMSLRLKGLIGSKRE